MTHLSQAYKAPLSANIPVAAAPTSISFDFRTDREPLTDRDLTVMIVDARWSHGNYGTNGCEPWTIELEVPVIERGSGKIVPDKRYEPEIRVQHVSKAEGRKVDADLQEDMRTALIKAIVGEAALLDETSFRQALDPLRSQIVHGEYGANPLRFTSPLADRASVPELAAL